MNLSKNLRKSNFFFKYTFALILVVAIILLLQKIISVLSENKIFVRLSLSPTPTILESGEPVIVSRVIDGDTIVLSTGDEIRYIGIDTPEIEGPQCFATEASKINSDLVLGKQIKAVKDTSETDKYGRLLRYVYIDDIFVNDYLVKNGYAKVMTVYPDTKYKNLFIEASSYARNNNLGLWGKCKE